MHFDSLSKAARSIWAKSGDPSGHGLLAHMLDVAAVAEQILNREAPVALRQPAATLGIPETRIIRWCAAMVGLHDIGKAIPGFQAKWDAGRAADEAAGLTFPDRLMSVDAHDRASAFELRNLLAPALGAHSASVGAAVAAHHGYVLLPNEINDARRVGEPAAWPAARRELFDAYWSTLAPPALPEDAAGLDLPLLAWLAGLTSTSDWIGSNVEWFAPGERAPSFVAHHAHSLRLAGDALDAIGWPRHRALLQEAASADTLIARIVGMPGLHARPLQVAADRLLDAVRAPALLIVEAPMGEGKTELALLAHLRLQAALSHRGLYIGLPTQATGNAMFDRTLRFLRAFGNDERLDIQLAHGGAMLDERLVELRGIHGEAGDSVRSSAWFSQRRRPLISPYGVGTIDQALLATLNVKHHFVRLWGLANRVVVLDEVHAYDTYTSGLIESLLRWLKALGCSVVLMSATLPRQKRDALLQAWGVAKSEVPALAYPRILLASDGAVNGESYESRELAPIELLPLDEELDSLAACAFDQVGQGGCGAVIVNTVDRAQQLYTKLHDRLAADATLMLFHARYPADERSAREKAVLAIFGKTGSRPERALLIATQVVEQSLDIDFDFLITDLAPVDLLLQRAGRLHRHDRERPPAHLQARLMVAGLLANRLPELKKTAWGVIYDPYILCRTWAFVSRESRWQLPQDIDRLVQTIYGDAELPAGLDPKAERYILIEADGIHRADVGHERRLAANAVLMAEAEPQNAYVGKPRGSDEGDFPGVRNVTRLSEDSITVLPVHTDNDAWRLRSGDVPFDPAVKPSHSLAKDMLGRQLKLNRWDVVKALRDAEVPKGFADHPWLRDVKPLCLKDGAATFGKVQVRLDPVLGIVYHQIDAAPLDSQETIA